MMTLPETATPPTTTRRATTITRSSIINARNNNTSGTSSNNYNNNFPAVPLTDAVPSSFQQQQQTLSSSLSSSSSSRLLSIAKYTSFHPYNIACSDPVLDYHCTNTNTTQPNKDDDAPTTSTASAATTGTSSSKMKSSLGAIAGSMGIAFFHLSKPRIPILVFNNYHTSAISSTSQEYYLAFQPNTTTTSNNSNNNNYNNNNNNNLLLASAYGTGILLWDVSGHTVNPLWGRVRVDTFTVSSSSSYEGTSITGTTNCHKNRITSLGWKHGSSILSSTNSLLYATTLSSAFLWDIRMSCGTSGSAGSNSTSLSTTSCRPCLRFGYSGTGVHNNNIKSNNNTSSSYYFVSMACSLINDECAVLDSTGIVRVYDPRMIGQIQHHPTTTNKERYCVDEFQAHTKLGAGIVYMPTTTSTTTTTTVGGDTNNSSSIQNSWITWGLDNTNDTILRHSDNNNSTIANTGGGNTRSQNKTVVKVWMKQQRTGTTDDNTTVNYNNNTEVSEKSISSSTSASYQTIAQHQSNNNTSIACVRVCPSISNTFVTIGFNMKGNNSYRTNNKNSIKNFSVPSWYADIWQLQSTTNEAGTDETTKKSDSNDVSLQLHKLASITNNTTTTSTTVSTATSSYRTNSRLRGGSVGSIYERDNNNYNTRSYNDNKINTGTSTSNKDILSIANQDQDGVGIGMLCAVEIGYSSYQTMPSGLLTNSSSINNDTSNLVQDDGLVLCCLSDNGYITTHALPETCDPVKRQEQQKLRQLRRIELRKKQQQLQQEQLRLLKEQQKQQATASISLTSIGNVVNTVSTQSIQNLNESVDGNIGTMTMPFDMDLSYTSNSNNNNTNNDDSISKTEASATSESQLITIDNTESDANRERNIDVNSSHSITNDNQGTTVRIEQQKHYIPSSVFMARIDTDRIPCPRLCSATFSSGVGGLAGFHNGQMQKMWQLLEKKDTSILSIVLASDTSKSELYNEKRTLQNPTDACSSNHSYPRTMKDMASMVKAATELQLRDQKVLEVSSTSFEDDDVQINMNKGLYQTPGSNMKAHDKDNSQSTALNHVVKISFPFDSYGRQIELALRLKLGDITNGLQSTPSLSNTEKTRPVIDSSSSIGSRLLLPMIPTTGRQQPTALQQEILERHHPFTSTSRKADAPEFFKSNFAPGLQRINSTGHQQPKTVTLKPTTDIVHERGVHAGEYSNSPTQHESLLFLRKFGKNQQDDIFIDNFLGNEALNQENMRNTYSRMKYRDTSTGSPSRLNIAVDTHQNVGVYALRIQEKHEEYKFELQRFLLNAKEACNHNADVCRSLDENEKAEVWEVLTDTVQTQLGNTTCHDYDGWSTTMRSGALGRGLVESFLQYYQSIGDVQMLATIVCILRSHIYRNIAESATAAGLQGHNIESLLPDDDNGKYDSYIRNYADLLYGWGLLNIRAELCKHLFHTATPLPEEYWQKSTSSSIVNATTTNNTNSNKPGIALIFQCPQCDGDTDIGTNFCRSCKDYAFRCSICDMSVRGLFTVCDLCGHGGHVQHIKDWFALNNSCPTGCGCMCVISSLSSPVANATQSETIPSGLLI